MQFEQFFITVHFGLFGSFLINDVKKVNPSFSLHFRTDFINFYVVNVKKHLGKSTDFFDEELNVFSEKYKPQKVEKLLIEKFPKKKIGDILMNQDIFPGLGNVIRNEVLFFAKIHPESIVEKIPLKKIADLVEEISNFSKASVELIDKKIWKSSAAVYGKKEIEKKPIKMYVSSAIKRKTYFEESIQKLYI